MATVTKAGTLLQAAEGERAAAEEAAQLLQQPAQEEGEDSGTEPSDQQPGEEKRMVMQAMHVLHEAGKHLACGRCHALLPDILFCHRRS